MLKYSIYVIRNKENEKVYIGKSINPQVRKRRHFYELGRGTHVNPHLQASFNKYGEAAFEFVILKYCDSKEEMNQAEIDEIQKARNSEDGCYNLLGGGNGGSHSEETKKKMSQAHLGKKMSPEAVEKMRQANLGNKNSLGHSNSEETKEKMKQAHLGNKNFLGHFHSEETKEKIRQSHLGKNHSEESKEKMKQSHLGKKRKPCSEETKEKMRQAHLGLRLTSKKGL